MSSRVFLDAFQTLLDEFQSFIDVLQTVTGLVDSQVHVSFFYKLLYTYVNHTKLDMALLQIQRGTLTPKMFFYPKNNYCFLFKTELENLSWRQRERLDSITLTTILCLISSRKKEPVNNPFVFSKESHMDHDSSWTMILFPVAAWCQNEFDEGKENVLRKATVELKT
jgi:hypothetical protein